MKNILKVFTAPYWHSNVTVVGDRESLERLKKAVQQALDNGCGETDVFESDGEGYSVLVACEQRTRKQWQELPVHYTYKVADTGTPEQWDYFQEFMKERFYPDGEKT